MDIKNYNVKEKFAKTSDTKKMRSTISDAKLEKYYSKFKEENRLTTRHGIVEFTVTKKYIDEFAKKIASKVKILDVGAGTGRYSIAL